MVERIHPGEIRRGPWLTRRLIIVVGLILALVATASFYFVRDYGRRASDEAFDRMLTGAALQIAERVGVSDSRIMVDLPTSAFELLALARTDRIFYRVIAPDGGTVTGYDDLPMPERAPASYPAIYSTVYSGETVRIAYAVRPLTERLVSGNVIVLVGQTVRERTALARDIASKAAIFIGLTAFAIIVLSILAVRYVLAPLNRVEKALLAREPNDLSPFSIQTPRELEAVVDAINRFMRRLDRRVTAVQDFVADAAHQLRTPITAIRAQADLAQQETDPDRLKRISRRIHDRSISVARLADQLLSRAMITHRADSVEREQLDLRRVALEADDETQSFEQNGEAVSLDLPEDPVMIVGDRFALREAVKNLIDNARLHGRPPFGLRVAVRASRPMIAVIDKGPGIPEALREFAGQRFGPSGRKGGSGLGLSIARDVAEFHHGRLIIEDCDGGILIGLELPSAGDAS